MQPRRGASGTLVDIQRRLSSSSTRGSFFLLAPHLPWLDRPRQNCAVGLSCLAVGIIVDVVVCGIHPARWGTFSGLGVLATALCATWAFRNTRYRTTNGVSMLLSWACGVWFAEQAYTMLRTHQMGTLADPDLCQIGVVAMRVLLVAGIIRHSRPLGTTQRRRLGAGGLIMAASISFLAWVLIVVPVAHGSDRWSPTTTIIVGGALSLDALVISLLVLLVVLESSQLRITMLTAAVCLLCGDLLSVTNSTGGVGIGSHVAWGVGFVSVAAAAARWRDLVPATYRSRRVLRVVVCVPVAAATLLAVSRVGPFTTLSRLG